MKKKPKPIAYVNAEVHASTLRLKISVFQNMRQYDIVCSLRVSI